MYNNINVDVDEYNELKAYMVKEYDILLSSTIYDISPFVVVDC